MSPVRQVVLARGDTRMVVWVDASLPLRAGVDVTGRDGVRWRVQQVYQQTLERQLLNRGWAVGGLA